MTYLIKQSENCVDIQGSVAYDMSSRAWNIIRLKKGILEEFPLLRERREKVSYRMILYRDPVDLFLAAEKMMDNKEVMPVLLYFTKMTPQGIVKIKPKKNKIIEAKTRAANFRKKDETVNVQKYGFSNKLEFLHYHWSKLSEQDQEDLLRAGIPGPK